MIELRNINIKRGKVVLIEEGKMDICNGYMTLLIGESGCGKTSLLNEVNLLSSQMAFDYKYDEINMNKLNQKEKETIRITNISSILQESSLFDFMSVKEHLEFILSNTNNNNSVYESEALLEKFMLDIDEECPVSSLSGGEKQRLAIVFGLLKEADLFVFDEPTAFLDDENSYKIIEAISLLARDFKKKVFIASHDEKLKDTADAIYEISDQKIECTKYDIQDNKLDIYINKNLDKHSNGLCKSKTGLFTKVLSIIILPLILALLVSTIIYNSELKKSIESQVVDSIHHYATIIKTNKKEITKKEQGNLVKEIKHNVYPYLEIPITIKNKDIVLVPYLEYSIKDSDIYEKLNKNAQIYYSYNLYKSLSKDDSKDIVCEFGEFNPDAILLPSYENDYKIFISYNTMLSIIENQYQDDADLKTVCLMTKIDSIDMYNQISNNLPDGYQLNTFVDVEDIVTMMSVLSSPFIILFCIVIILIYFVYKIYLLINEKRNQGLYMLWGCKRSQLIKSRITNESIMSVISYGVAMLVEVYILTIISSLNINILRIMFLVSFVGCLSIFIINSIIYILFIQKYSIEILLE